MSLSLTQTYTAISPGITSSFLAIGGTAPYTYAVRSGGAGGTIDSTGIYTPPSTLSEEVIQTSDTIQVRDSLGAIAIASILIGTPLTLVCDIIQSQLGLASGRVYVFDQKIFEPTDNDLFVVISVVSVKPFGNIRSYDTDGFTQIQSLNCMATLDINAISRGPAARDQKEFILLALQSTYSEQQQEANSFYIAKLPTRFINISDVDGAAIPYRYVASVNIQYAVTKKSQVPYYNVFQSPHVVVNP